MIFNLCFDINYIISLIDKKFLYNNYSIAKVKKILISIIIKGIRSKKYKASEYIRIKLYLLSKNDIVAFIEREFYIINNLIIKALIGIDILKSKGIILNL